MQLANFGYDYTAMQVCLDRSLVQQSYVSLDPHADIGALTPSADWIKCCFSKNFLESF